LVKTSRVFSLKLGKGLKSSKLKEKLTINLKDAKSKANKTIKTKNLYFSFWITKATTNKIIERIIISKSLTAKIWKRTKKITKLNKNQKKYHEGIKLFSLFKANPCGINLKF